jgi:DNA-binding NtrC family response regulator
MLESRILKLSNIAAPILISGETGTGKSYMAKTIYDKSEINKEKFLTLHLACIKEELFESELFGHKKGAFTGAVENKNGYLKEVGRGTLFLDEIGELSLDAQKKLLYVLEEKKFVPVGSSVTMQFEGRLIFATNKNLEKMVKEGKFREDLYYRLMIFQITLKPLRENLFVLQSNIQAYFNQFKQTYNKPDCVLANDLQEFLKKHEWRGNFRELKNCIESLVAMSENIEITSTDLPSWIKPGCSTEICTESIRGDYAEAMGKFEELYLRKMFKIHGGKVNETARQIKISKVNLINKARKYHINTLKMRVTSAELVEGVAA